jgi:hypothetical protein
MLTSIQRRIVRLQASIPVDMNAERLFARAQARARRTGCGLEWAICDLLGGLSAARYAARQEVLAGGHYPVWIGGWPVKGACVVP